MIRILGIVVFSVSVSLCGFLMSHSLSSKARKRREFIELIYAIKNGIQYGKLSLREIFSSFSGNELKKCGFLKALCENENASIEEVLTDFPTGLTDKENELIFAFAKECGKSTFSEEEIKNCERYVLLLEALDKQLSSEENTKKLVYGKLGILAGILSCILLM